LARAKWFALLAIAAAPANNQFEQRARPSA
jgi:hypothetical protein